ncbi:MAG: S41 family peptidase [Candidatus Roizmanbacteria bacterium]|nr:S41 family peptidase [Candidatus Roizmanbacteria bacterium]
MNQKNKLTTINKIANALLIFSAILFLFGSGYRLGQYRSQQNVSASTGISKTGVTTDMSLFWNVWNILEEKYVNETKLNKEKMVFGAIKGMVASLNDPYTYFMTPTENKESKDDLGGLYEGIGAQLGKKDDAIIIVSPLKGSPAEASGVLSGDAILAVNNKSTKGWTIGKAVNEIRGKRGTEVLLTLGRESGTIDLKIKRESIVIDPVELSYKTSKDCLSENCPQVAYIRIVQFGDQTNEKWDKVVSEVAQKWSAQSIRGLVLDVRGNPGGYLESAVYLASDFLKPNSVVVKQVYSKSRSKEYKVTRSGFLYDIPVAVLVDQGSASAAEILAGALKDYGKAQLVGEKTFGKGSVQEAMDLNQGTGLHVTVAKWVLPKGAWINGTGIVPDIKVDNSTTGTDTLTDVTDNQLQKAIETVIGS